MPVEIEVIGEDASAVTRDLREWLVREGLDGVKVDAKATPPQPGEMAGGIVTTLLLFMNAKVVTEVVRSLQTWFKTKKPKVEIIIKTKKKQITLKGENMTFDQTFVDQVSQLIKEAS